MRFAIPTNTPGGLEAHRFCHFGHCDVFTVIDISADNVVANVTTIENVAHDAGGCMAPINLLKVSGVEAIVVSGMGIPLMQWVSQAWHRGILCRSGKHAECQEHI